MRPALLFLPILLLASGSAREGSAPLAAEDNTPARLAAMFEHAKRHETAEILRLRPAVARSGDRAWQIGYWVALYISSPEKYEPDFVEHFPADADGIMRILYDQIELANLTPEFLFSFEALGRIGEQGNRRAIRKVLEGVGSSDGAVSESLCDSLSRIFEKQLEKTLAVLGTLPAERRKEISVCFTAWDPEGLRHLESSLSALKDRTGAAPEQRARIREISGWIGAAEASQRATPQADAGIEGIVLIGPTRPTVRVGDDRPDEVPYPTTLQVLGAADGNEVARVESGADGKFRIALPPGEYLLQPVQLPGRRYPNATEVTVRVVAGKYAQLTVHLDSGLR